MSRSPPRWLHDLMARSEKRRLIALTIAAKKESLK